MPTGHSRNGLNAIPGLETPVTASMGIISISSDEDFASLHERADRLLYGAKDDGRNKTP